MQFHCFPDVNVEAQEMIPLSGGRHFDISVLPDLGLVNEIGQGRQIFIASGCIEIKQDPMTENANSQLGYRLLEIR